MPSIVILEGYQELDAYDVDLWEDGHTVSFGRSELVTWSYPDYDEISRHHLSIRKKGDSLYLRDEATVNGTQVDGKALQHAVRMRTGVDYVVGRLRILYEDDASSKIAEADEHSDYSSIFPEEFSFAMLTPVQEQVEPEVKPALAARAVKKEPVKKEPIRRAPRRTAKRSKRNKRVRDRVSRMRSRLRIRHSVIALLCCLTFILTIFGVLFTIKQIHRAEALTSFEAVNIAEPSLTKTEEKPRELDSRLTQSASPAGLSTPIIVSAISQPLNVPTSDFGDIIGSGHSAMGLGEGFGGDGDGDGDGLGEGGLGSSEEIKSSFVGEFWDLKRNRSRGESRFYPVAKSPDVHSFLSDFFNDGWPRHRFSSFLKSPVRLYATCFLMPNASDLEAMHAYDPSGKYGLEKSRWVIIYRAQVQAPKSGKFRFVGAADSVMGVRFNKRNVLNVGLHNLRTGVWGNMDTYEGKHPQYLYENCEEWNILCQGFTAGNIFEVKQGEWYDMEILISEIGGGNFGFCLLIDELVDGVSTSMKTTRGKMRNGLDGQIPVLQLFRTQLVEPDVAEIYATMKYSDDVLPVNPEYDKDSYVWPARHGRLKSSR